MSKYYLLVVFTLFCVIMVLANNKEGINMTKIYKLGQAAKYLGYHPKTLEKYDVNGTLVAHRTKTNRRYYTQEQLDNFLNKQKPITNKLKIAYGRVSSNHQKGNLTNQMTFIRNYVNAKGIILDQELTDIGSGLNYKRYNWNKLLDLVDQNKVDQIYITYKDRFVRFGFDWFNEFCKKHGCTIIVLNNIDTSPEQEVVNDLISIMHAFTSRVYGLRKYKSDIEHDIKEKEQ